eukprot:jgi/Picsp_1/6490/NSC_03834-R1_---NA---
MEEEGMRKVDSLNCELSIQQTQVALARNALETEKEKVKIVAKDSRSVLNELLGDIHEAQSLKDREVAELKNIISKYEVEQHGLQRDVMHEHIKYNAAADSSVQQKAIIRQLARYLGADTNLGRDVIQQNIILWQEVEKLMATNTSLSVKLGKLQQLLQAVLKDLRTKELHLEQAENDVKSLHQSYVKKIRTMQESLTRKQDEASKMHGEAAQVNRRGKLLESLMHEYDLSETQVQDKIRNDSKKISRMKATIEALEGELESFRSHRSGHINAKLDAEAKIQELEKALKSKSRRIQTLEEALTNQNQLTPSGPRAVGTALDTVGNLVSQLAGSPGLNDPSKSVEKTARLSSRFDASRQSPLCPDGGPGGDSNARAVAWQGVSEGEGKENVGKLGKDPQKAIESAKYATKVTDIPKDGRKPMAPVQKANIGSKRKLLSVSSIQRPNMPQSSKMLNPPFKLPKLQKK